MLQSGEKSKDLALQAVGRTLVNFQRLENNLKLAARLGPIQGTTPAIQRDVSRRQERAETLTLGQAIQAWLKYCDGPDPQDVWTPDLFDVTLRTTFALESDTESRKAHARALTSLLETRNQLVHTRLMQLHWDWPEECDALVAELDAVNNAIAEQSDYVTSLLKAILAAHQEHAAAVMAVLEEPTRASPTNTPGS